ncbi:MAG: hypothetical protein WC471_00410 [Candidatus Woesearchaeota archaeon]|jgi:hypothetical protein
MNKKAQELSISTIIIAAIAVIILVVIVAIFTGRLGIFTTSLGGTGLEKTKDVTMYSCIPLDRYYQDIDAAQAAYVKDKSNTAALEAYDKAIGSKATLLTSTCGTQIVKANCPTDKCQWVGKQ